MLPRVLRGFNVYLDGENFIARVTECTLPTLNLQVAEFRAGGLDAPVDLDMGMEKLDVQFTIAEYTPSIIRQFGLLTADRQLVVRGALQRQGEAAVKFAVRLQGGIKTLERPALSQGEPGSLQVTINCNSYIEEQDGQEDVNIDILNFRRVIGGVDQLETIRAAL